ncbi:MAG: hypothetical protein ABI678_22535 [Kofleriaceae bacterium]
MPVTIHANFQVHQVRATNVQLRDHRSPSRPVVRHDNHDRPRTVIVRPRIVTRPIYTPAPIYTAWTPAPSYTYQPAAIQLLGPTSLANDQMSFAVGSLGGATTLELDTAGGSTYVTQVTVVSADGSYQVLPVNQMLSAQNPAISLSIDGCNTPSRIVVDGHSDWGGALSIRAL